MTEPLGRDSISHVARIDTHADSESVLPRVYHLRFHLNVDIAMSRAASRERVQESEA